MDYAITLLIITFTLKIIIFRGLLERVNIRVKETLDLCINNNNILKPL